MGTHLFFVILGMMLFLFFLVKFAFFGAYPSELKTDE